MVLLTQIPIDTLKTFASILWSHPVETSERCGFVFDIIGSVKYFHERNVCFKFISKIVLH